MGLPKLNTAVHILELPSTGEEIKFRPFLVKEQKLLMLAQESEDNKEMLDRWLSIGEGKFGEWSIQGAKDAVSYVDKQMDLQSIMDWQFLRRHFVNLHNDLD